MPLEQDPDDSIQTLMDVIAALEISPGAQAQLPYLPCIMHACV